MKTNRSLFIKSFFALMLAMPSLGYSQTTPPAKSQAEIEAAKAAAAGISGTFSNQSIKIDANGRPVMENGKPVTQQAGASSMRDGLNLFNGYTGLTGLNQQSSPGSAGRTGLATTSATNSFDFQCSKINNLVRGSISIGVKIESCSMTEGVKLFVCENTAKGGLCNSDNDWKGPVRVPVNQFTNYTPHSFGLGCNSSGDCRLTVKSESTFGGNDQSMQAQSESAWKDNTSNPVSGTLRSAVIQGNYATKIQEIGSSLKKCADLNANSMANGVAQSCDGEQKVILNTPQNATECSGVKQCLKYSYATQTFTKTCTRTFPLTENIKTYEYYNTFECIRKDGVSLNGELVDYDSCKFYKNRETQKIEDPRVTYPGMVKVGESDKTCLLNRDFNSERSPAQSPSECLQWGWTEYWVSTDRPTTTSEVSSPSPVTGACDVNPSSGTRFSSCQDNSWFGRTEPSSSCTIASMGDDGKITTIDLDYTKKAGCGFCTKNRVGVTCYGAPSPTDEISTCDSAEVNGCTLQSITPRNFSSPGGLVISQDEVYSCQKLNQICTQWSKGSGDSCLSANISMGMENAQSAPATADGSFNNAVVGASLLDGTARGMDGAQSAISPKLFNGYDNRCSRATGGIGQLFGRNCCRTDIERPIGRVLTRGGCDMNEARLSAARRSRYATYIGSYCSRKINLLFTSICLEQTETYCTFGGILPRIVHEQGRGQLISLATSGGSGDTQKETVNFPYSSKNTSDQKGYWSPIKLVNGVGIATWSWPSFCSDPAKVNQNLLKPERGSTCPSTASVWIAACDNASGCGALPDDPADSSGSWQLTLIDALSQKSTALSKYAIATGACSTSTEQCQFNISAWPAGAGGRAVISKDVNWPLYMNQPIVQNNTSAAAFVMNNVGDMVVKGYPIPGMSNGSLPDTVKMDISRDGGQTWVSLNLPTNKKDSEIDVPEYGYKVTGYCDAMTNLCGFRIIGNVSVSAKPWGDPRWPDCSGFTPGQIAVLDFGKMDLSEWLSSVMDKMGSGQTPADLTKIASDQFKAFNNVYTSGQSVAQKASKPASNLARAIPSEGFGPFDVKLVISGFWPETTGDPSLDKTKVFSATVDWGDCSSPQELFKVPPSQGTGFSGTHTYQAPDTLTCMGSPQRDVDHKVKISLQTEEGNKEEFLMIRNAWSNFPGGKNNNSLVGGTVSNDPNNPKYPPPPRVK